MNGQRYLETLLTSDITPRLTSGANKPELLLLTCMDFRYPRRIVDTLDANGLRGKYDHLILAGASLGVLHKKKWRTTFLNQLQFAIDHHQVNQVLILDHRDCGAYREFVGITADDSDKEKKAHAKVCRKVMRFIVRKFPQLKGNVRAALMPVESLDDLGCE